MVFSDLLNNISHGTLFFRFLEHFLIFPAEVLLKNYLIPVKFQKSYLFRSDLL